MPQSDQDKLPKCINQSLEYLSTHPFSIIGLADREKFHTGLLAYTLQKLADCAPELFKELLEKLWNQEKFSPMDDVKVLVEQKSVDLIINDNLNTLFFAEIKLKTTLRKNQFESYQKELPQAEGVVLSLFSNGSIDKNCSSFPSVISSFFNERTSAQFLIGSSDEIILIRMWVNYLKHLWRTANWLEELKDKSVPERDEFVERLEKLKLKGIFEWVRYNAILNKLNVESCSKSPKFEKKPYIFNSHGNSGIDCQIQHKFPYGLQWQAGALKLFAIDPNFISNQESKARDKFLMTLKKNIVKNFRIVVIAL